METHTKKKLTVKKRRITLIEVMIVMVLIAMIAGVLAYNYRGTLEEGKAFKTREGIEKIKTILLIEVAENPSIMDSLDANPDAWAEIVTRSPLANNPKSLIKDGWGTVYDVDIVLEDGERVIKVHSKNYEEYKRKHPNRFSDDDE